MSQDWEKQHWDNVPSEVDTCIMVFVKLTEVFSQTHEEHDCATECNVVRDQNDNPSSSVFMLEYVLSYCSV